MLLGMMFFWRFCYETGAGAGVSTQVSVTGEEATRRTRKPPDGVVRAADGGGNVAFVVRRRRSSLPVGRFLERPAGVAV